MPFSTRLWDVSKLFYVSCLIIVGRWRGVGGADPSGRGVGWRRRTAAGDEDGGQSGGEWSMKTLWDVSTGDQR